jgi:hypothetical protein
LLAFGFESAERQDKLFVSRALKPLDVADIKIP